MNKLEENKFWALVKLVMANDGKYIELPKAAKFRERLEFSTSMLKSLEEYGLIGVATVNEMTWKYSGPGRTYYKVWLTDKAEEWMQGRVEVEKPCTLDTVNYYSFHLPVCPRHSKRHTEIEWNTYHKTGKVGRVD